MNKNKTLVVIGGGAAGFFGAITAASTNPLLDIILLEQSIDVLGKVKISGGGRCNVTHACFDVKELVKYYPRGNKELQSAFYEFNCEHTIDWFLNKGIELKTEEDGRMFPITDDSATIVNGLIDKAKQLNIQVLKQSKVVDISINEAVFTIHFNQQIIRADYLLITSGSSNMIWEIIKKMQHTIIAPVPSLFSFNTKNNLFKDLAGISFSDISIKIKDTTFQSNGNLLITHTGLSGPAILKLSAFAALDLATRNYQFSILINWMNCSTQALKDELNNIKINHAKKQVHNYAPTGLANRFWKNCLKTNGIDKDKQWANLTKNDILKLSTFLTQCEIQIAGKSTNKDEFVTAGGVDLKEVNFKTMQSKIIPNLYFAGEVLNIDAVTGGFNFQAAWTTSYIAGNAIASC